MVYCHHSFDHDHDHCIEGMTSDFVVEQVEAEFGESQLDLKTNLP